MTLETGGSGVRNFDGTGTATLSGGDGDEPFNSILAHEFGGQYPAGSTAYSPDLREITHEAFTPPENPRIALVQRPLGYSALKDTAPFYPPLTSSSAN